MQPTCFVRWAFLFSVAHKCLPFCSSARQVQLTGSFSSGIAHSFGNATTLFDLCSLILVVCFCSVQQALLIAQLVPLIVQRAPLTVQPHHNTAQRRRSTHRLPQLTRRRRPSTRQRLQRIAQPHLHIVQQALSTHRLRQLTARQAHSTHRRPLRTARPVRSTLQPLPLIALLVRRTVPATLERIVRKNLAIVLQTHSGMW